MSGADFQRDIKWINTNAAPAKIASKGSARKVRRRERKRSFDTKKAVGAAKWSVRTARRRLGLWILSSPLILAALSSRVNSGNSNVFGWIVVSTGFLSACISARTCFRACTYTSKSQNHCPTRRDIEISRAVRYLSSFREEKSSSRNRVRLTAHAWIHAISRVSENKLIGNLISRVSPQASLGSDLQLEAPRR